MTPHQVFCLFFTSSLVNKAVSAIARIDKLKCDKKPNTICNGLGVSKMHQLESDRRQKRSLS